MKILMEDGQSLEYESVDYFSYEEDGSAVYAHMEDDSEQKISTQCRDESEARHLVRAIVKTGNAGEDYFDIGMWLYANKH